MIHTTLLNPANQPVAQGLHPYRASRAGCAAGSVALAFLALFPIIGFSVFFVAMAAIWGEWHQSNQLAAHGRPVQAEVLDTWISSSDDSTTYMVQYRYLPAELDRDPFVTREPVSFELYAQLEPGAVVPAVYLPANPSVARLKGNDAPKSLGGTLLFSGFIIVWTALFGGLPLVVIAGMLRGARKERRLASGGQLLEGEVIAFSGSTDSDGDYAIKLRYRVTSPSGQPICGEVNGIYNHLAKTPLQRGDHVAVWYVDDQTHTML